MDSTKPMDLLNVLQQLVAWVVAVLPLAARQQMKVHADTAASHNPKLGQDVQEAAALAGTKDVVQAFCLCPRTEASSTLRPLWISTALGHRPCATVGSAPRESNSRPTTWCEPSFGPFMPPWLRIAEA